MTSPLRTPLSAAMMLGGAAIGITAAVAWTVMSVTRGIGESDPLLLLIALGALGLEVSGAWVHDAQHRRRGETPHALRGQDDRNRPEWLPRRRS